MSSLVQGYFAVAVGAILIFTASFYATLKLGDAVSRMIF